jgi:hypothetical protein
MRKKRISKLKKLMNNHDVSNYTTTPEDCKRWFGVINRELFDGCLPSIDILIGWRRKTHAYYVTGGRPDGRICVNKKYPSKKFFVEVLAHECVHHYQWVFEGDVGHGQTFQKWIDKFKTRGLYLAEYHDS